MKNIAKILNFLAPYKFHAILNVSFNLLSALFSVFSITMLIPFLGILLSPEIESVEVEEFTLSVSSAKDYFYYYITLLKDNYGPQTTLIIVSTLMIFLSLLRNLFRYLAMFNLAPIRNGVIKDLRNRLFVKIVSLPLGYFSEEKKGDIIARMTNDVQEIEWSIISSIEMMFKNPLELLIYLFLLLALSPQLTLFVFILLPLSGLIIGRVAKNLRKTSFKGQKKMGDILSTIEETLGGLRIIKAFNAEGKISNRFFSQNNLYTKIMIKMFRRRYLANPVSEFLGIVVMIIILVYGAMLVLNENSSLAPEELITYLAAFYMIIAPAKGFTTAYYNVQKGLASVDRINMILKADNKITEKATAIHIHEFKESIEYKNINFKYETDYVLRNVNLKIEKGKTVALVGQSGSGKSTMVDLLPRFYDVEEGDILIDGISIKDFKLKDLRNLMGNVNQDPILFNDSFFNNISFGVEGATEEEVINAARVANAHDFIINTKHGYYTNIGDRGGKLSGGQRQRISIARAVLKNPPIMILDEATSALDTESERLVQDALTYLMKNRTSLVIAHRLSTVQHADLICVLHEGEIVERGKHEELIKLNGVYKKLHDSQIFE